MEAEELLKKRFKELADKCYRSNQYTFTGFLGLADMACFYELERELSYVPYTVWEGNGQCERVMVRFGSQEQLGYLEEFPIACVAVRPAAEKFAEELTHRDFLGALMNLGIERSVLGDIFVQGHTAYLYCLNNMASFIQENLTKVRHTTVRCRITENAPEFAEADRQELSIQVSSDRIDGIISKVYNLSRSESVELFRQKKIFVNGRLCENNSQTLKEQDKVSVRGYGRFEYSGTAGISRKGKLNVRILYYGARKGRS